MVSLNSVLPLLRPGRVLHIRVRDTLAVVHRITRSRVGGGENLLLCLNWICTKSDEPQVLPSILWPARAPANRFCHTRDMFTESIRPPLFGDVESKRRVRPIDVPPRCMR